MPVISLRLRVFRPDGSHVFVPLLWGEFIHNSTSRKGENIDERFSAVEDLLKYSNHF